MNQIRRILTLLSLLCCLVSKGYSQQSTTTTQVVDVSLTNIISLKFASTGTQNGTNLNIGLNLLTDLLNGITSSTQNLTVSSTKGFNITVKTNSANFTYTGSYLLGTLMPVAGKLKIKVPSNSTGGSIAGSFANFANVTSSAQNLITGGTTGTNKNFSVQYQGLPGLGFALGTYSTQIVFTATQQ